MSRLHLHHVTAVTLDDDQRVLEHAALVIEDARIVYVGPQATAPTPAAEDEVIDAAGMVAMPGLINGHTHLAMTLFRGAADDLPLMTWLQEKIWPVEAHLTRDDVYWASLLGIAEQLRAGVTTFADMYWHVEAVADAVRDSGIRAALAGVVIGIVPDAAGLLANAIARVTALKAEGHPRITPLFGPHAPYTVPASMLRQVVDAAAALGVGIHTHLSETVGEVEASVGEHGVPPIAYMEQVGLFAVPVAAAHVVHTDAREREILAQRGVGVIHCPSSNMKLGSGIAPIPDYVQRGITVGLGTDGAGSNNTLDVLREVRAAALLHKVGGDATVLPAPQALALATRGNARAFGLTEVGALQVGFLADVVLYDFAKPHLTPGGAARTVSHLAYAAYASDVDTVIVHGRVLMRGRQLLTLDEQRIYGQIADIARRLF